MTVLRLTSHKDWAKDSSVKSMLRNFKQESLGKRKKVLDWDLSVVLRQLARSPFEPLRDVDFKFVTFKALFLFALASINRRSEIHACLWKTVVFTEDDHMHVETDPTFIFKTALHLTDRAASSRITIEGLRNRAPEREEMLLCPVRAMRIYMKAALGRRTTNQTLLFAPIQKLSDGRTDISKQTVSSWMKKTIVMCLKLAGQPVPKLSGISAHTVRRAGASLAFLGHVPVEDSLKAGPGRTTPRSCHSTCHPSLSKQRGSTAWVPL